jgi:hypothetical protein
MAIVKTGAKDVKKVLKSGCVSFKAGMKQRKPNTRRKTRQLLLNPLRE